MKLKIGATLFLSLWLVTFAAGFSGLSKMTRVAITQSTIDSSCVGCTTPAAAAFTTIGTSGIINAGGTVTAPLFSGPVNGNVTGNVNGNVTGNLNGNAFGTQLSYQNALIDGNGTLTLTGSIGLNLGYNQSGGGGESDFVNQQTGSGGGFSWFNTTTTSIGAAIMRLTGSGVLTVNTVVANLTGTVTGSLIGNASTASALAATPGACANYAAMFGISAAGNAVCAVTVNGRSASVNSTGTAANSTAATTVPLNATMPDTNYAASCMVINPTGFPSVLGATKSTTSVTVTIQNGQGSAAVASGGSEIDCTVTGS